MPLPRISIGRLVALIATTCAAALSLGLPAGAGAFTWELPATTLSAGPTGSAGADVAVAPDGTTTIAYEWEDYPHSWIRVATRPAGQSEFILSDVSIPFPEDGYLGADRAPRIAVSPDGTTTVVWFDGSGDQIWTATRPAGQTTFPDPTQTAPQRLSAPPLSSYTPEVTAAGDGSVTAVWEARDWAANLRQVQTATRLPGQASFGSRENLSVQGPIGYPPLPQVAAAADGTTTAVWSRYDGSRDRIQTATRHPGQPGFPDPTETPPQDLSTEEESATTPEVAVGANGQATVVWHEKAPVERVEAATRQPGASTFQGPEVIGGSLDTPAQVAYSPNGQTTVVFGYSEIFSSTRAPNSSVWDTPQRLSDDNRDVFPRIAVAPDGRETVVWLAGLNTNTSSIRSATRASGSTAWSTPETLAPDVGVWNVPAPRIAVGANGRATAVWTDTTVLDPNANPPVILDRRVQTVSSDATHYTLDVETNGTGSGTVTSSPAGIDCGAACSSDFPLSTQVVLTANEGSGSSFSGWDGACSGNGGTCTVPILGDRSVTATFAGRPPKPSNNFKITSSKVRGSSIISRVRVPGPGRISQRGSHRTGRGGAPANRGACTASQSVRKAASYTLTCRLNRAARKQRRSGPLRVKLRTTFAPAGGTARSTERTVVFRSLKPRNVG